MRRSLSGDAGSFDTPRPARHEQREQPWYQGLTQVEYSYYYDKARIKAFWMLGNDDDADEVANKVMDELWKHPPTKVEIEAHLYTRTTCRAIDCARSSRYQFWKERLIRLYQKNEDGEEYDTDLGSLSEASAEEAFLSEEESRRRRQQIVQAINQLEGLERMCFVLRLADRMEPKEIAQRLHIPIKLVYGQLQNARRQVRALITREEEKQNKQ